MKRKLDSIEIRQKFCRYGPMCYRRNVEHFSEYLHPSDHPVNVDDDFFLGQTNWIRNDNIYFNSIPCIPFKYNYQKSLSLKTILSKDENKLEYSLLSCMVVDVDWVMSLIGNKKSIIHILHHHPGEQLTKEQKEEFPNLKLIPIQMSIPYGTHHSKFGIFVYKKHVNIFITTANLLRNDWELKTQTIWMSGNLERNKTKESPTNFRHDLFKYFSYYSIGVRENVIRPLEKILINCDFSSINVHLVASVPGYHLASNNEFGLLKIKKILNENKIIYENNDELIGQFSSIGTMGSKVEDWLSTTFLQSTRMNKIENFKIIYPTVENVKMSFEGYRAGGSLPYSDKVEQKQKWLNNYMNQWKCERNGRNECAPHNKCYFVINKINHQVKWFLLTSSNMSKAALGNYVSNGNKFFIRSFELGVFFHPHFVNSFKRTNYLPKSFNLPVDYPLTSYGKEDVPWVFDKKYDSEDRFGNKYG
ncbi:hypothetical protein SNEBB_006039 [Seison nebaliae]|nr:hypothetical protein SNEBB_006039 [Seison nebaliae]